jgi:hypothetical protein
VTVGVFALLLAIPVTSEAVTATNSDFDTVDGNEVPVSLIRTFAISGAGDVTNNVDILIDFSKCDDPAPGPTDTRCLGLGNSFNDDIAFQLTNPSGTTVNLVFSFINSPTESGTYDGQTPGARVTVTFDDAGQPLVSGQNLQFGRFQPVGPLTAFNGNDENPNGTWTLTVQDAVGGAPLQFYSATLCINEPCPAISSLIIGDVDASNARDAVDARLVLQVLVGVNPPAAIHVSAAGDVNADGILDNRDSSVILALAAGRIPPPPEPSFIQALDTGSVTAPSIVITGSAGAVPPSSTVNLRNATTNGPPISVTAATDGSFGQQLDVRLDGDAGDTIVVDINDINGNGSPARAAILVQQDDGEGPASLALTQ